MCRYWCTCTVYYIIHGIVCMRIILWHMYTLCTLHQYRTVPVRYMLNYIREYQHGDNPVFYPLGISRPGMLIRPHSCFRPATSWYPTCEHKWYCSIWIECEGSEIWSTSEFADSAGSVKAAAYASTSAVVQGCTVSADASKSFHGGNSLSFKQDATKELELDESNDSLGHMARMDM